MGGRRWRKNGGLKGVNRELRLEPITQREDRKGQPDWRVSRTLIALLRESAQKLLHFHVFLNRTGETGLSRGAGKNRESKGFIKKKV